MSRPTPLPVVLALCGLPLLAPRALAEAAIISLEPRDERYVFCEVDDGFLRMDKQSGQVSLCRPRNGGGWICQAVPDDRTSYEREISRLQSEVANLRQAMRGQGTQPAEPPVPDVPAAPAPRLDSEQTEVLPRSDQAPPVPGDAGAKSSAPPSQAPGRQDVERTMTVFEQAWRRLIEMMVNLQRELQKKS